MVKSSKIYLKLIPRHNNHHNSHNDVVAGFIYNFGDDTKQYFNFGHGDLPTDCTFDKFKSKLESNKTTILVNNKKNYKYWLENLDLVDVNIFGFIENNEIVDDVHNLTRDFLQYGHRNLNNFNLVLPYVIHQQIFDEEVNQIKSIKDTSTDSYCFKFFNNIISDTLYEVEKNGIKIDKDVFSKYFKSRTYDGFAFTNYNIYNPTGRPSNAYDGINYVALKKDDGSRSSFVSRYGDDGYFLMVDFTGFHPYIVANLIKYDVPEEETIYEHLAKYYYNVENVTPELISKSKKLTMVNLYGQINEQYLNIEYFKKIEELKNVYWTKFEKHGYVTTPIYKRKITNKHISDPNKNKLFAYIIQAAETEYGMDRLQACLKFTKGKQILPVLYNYDAILFDVGNVDESDISDLIEIIKNKRFKVKVYKGNNYNDLKLVPI